MKDNLIEYRIELTLNKEVNSIIEELCRKRGITKDDLLWGYVRAGLYIDHFSKFDKKGDLCPRIN